MRVLLISPNIEALPDPVFPLGLAYISGALETAGISHRVLDLCFSEDYAGDIADAIDDFHPDMIGLSLRNVDNVSFPRYTSYLEFYQRIVADVRSRSRAPVVLGGSGFSLMPERILAFLDADAGVAGQGERAFLHLIRQWQRNGRFGDALGERICDARRSVDRDLDAGPLPDRSRFDNRRYLKQGGMGNLQTKRGCPFGCIYCTYPLIEGNRVRCRSPRAVCDEMESLLSDGIDAIFIVDNEFNFPADHARAVCREIIHRRLPMRWSCYVNPAHIDASLIDLMLAAGCSGVEFGSDAAESGMLRKLGKDFSVADLTRASQNCRKSGMPFCHSLLLGGPGETMQTVRSTLDAVRQMNPTAVICMTGIRVFPHTRLADTAMQEGLITAETDFLKPVFYLSPAIQETILPFLKSFAERHPNWIFPGLHINMTPELQTKLRRFGVRGPLWEYMQMARRFDRS